MNLNSSTRINLLGFELDASVARTLAFVLPAVIALLVVATVQIVTWADASMQLSHAQSRLDTLLAANHEAQGVLSEINADTSLLTTIKANRAAALAALVDVHALAQTLPMSDVRLSEIDVVAGAQPTLTLTGDARSPHGLLDATKAVPKLQVLGVSHTATTGYTWTGRYAP